MFETTNSRTHGSLHFVETTKIGTMNKSTFTVMLLSYWAQNQISYVTCLSTVTSIYSQKMLLCYTKKYNISKMLSYMNHYCVRLPELETNNYLINAWLVGVGWIFSINIFRAFYKSSDFKFYWCMKRVWVDVIKSICNELALCIYILYFG